MFNEVYYDIILMDVYNIYQGISFLPQFPDEKEEEERQRQVDAQRQREEEEARRQEEEEKK